MDLAQYYQQFLTEFMRNTANPWGVQNWTYEPQHVIPAEAVIEFTKQIVALTLQQTRR